MEIESINRKYIMSKTPKRYEIKRKGLAVIITKLEHEETKVIPEVFSKPTAPKSVITPTYLKPLDARKKLDEMAAKKNDIKVEEKPKVATNTLSQSISMPNFSNFKEIESFVKQQQKENSERNKEILKKLNEKKNEDEQEDIDDLVNGNIHNEQKLINDEYLKMLEFKALKRLYKMVTGIQANNSLTKYEMRKVILEKYNELPASKKQLVYEASKLKDD